MSTVVFIENKKPDKKLKNTLIYKVYLSNEQREEIINQIAQTLPPSAIDKYIVSITVDVELKEYDTKNT